MLCAITHLLIPNTAIKHINTVTHAVYGAMLWALLKELEPSVCKILIWPKALIWVAVFSGMYPRCVGLMNHEA